MSSPATTLLEPRPVVVPPATALIDAHVVILNNYLRPHHVAVYRAFAKRVRKLTILLSTPMESDRQWQPDWGDLNVIVQKNLTWTTRFRSRAGFEVPNFVHFPLDTPWRLLKLRPDVVFSYEFGARTFFSSLWRLVARRSRLVVVGNMSKHIERERGISRRMVRSMLRRMADRYSYNGPGCREYLQEIGLPADRLDLIPYVCDPGKIWHGEKHFADDGWRRVVFSGVLENRKGVPQLVQMIRRWKETGPKNRLELILCGAGGMASSLKQLECPQVRIRLPGHVDDGHLREVYAEADFCIFPSLADEWGLVTVEAMASGLPVLGSVLAQSCETLVRDGVNGWIANPLNEDEFLNAFVRAMDTDASELAGMSLQARQDVAHITAEWAAGKFVDSLLECMRNRR